MGFFSGALTGLTRGVGAELDRQRAEAEQSQAIIQQIALRGVLDPNTPPELRTQYQALLRGTPYEQFASFEIPTSPEQQLERQFGPLLSSLKLLGALGEGGALTPELAQQIETMSGQRFLPRRDVPGGPAPAPGQGVAGTALREEVDISRFRPAGVVSITLANGQTVPLDALRGLPAELVMHLVKGPGGVSVRTYGDLFGDLIKPGLRNRPIVTDDGGRIILRDDFFVREPTPSDVQSTARFQLRQQAISTYQEWLATHPGDVAGATDRAVAIDPSFGRPATLPAPAGALSPQQEVWRKYFAGGSLADAERTYIQRQLQTQASQDPRFAELMRIVTAYGSKREPGQEDGRTPDEQALYQNALKELRVYFGIPPVEQGGPVKVDGFLLKLGKWLGVVPKVGGRAATPRAQEIYSTWTRTKIPVPARYWPTLTTDERRWLLALGVKVEGLK